MAWQWREQILVALAGCVIAGVAGGCTTLEGEYDALDVEELGSCQPDGMYGFLSGVDRAEIDCGTFPGGCRLYFFAESEEDWTESIDVDRDGRSAFTFEDEEFGCIWGCFNVLIDGTVQPQGDGLAFEASGFELTTEFDDEAQEFIPNTDCPYTARATLIPR